MVLKRMALIGALLASGGSQAQEAPLPLSGYWSGTYTCAQGITAVDLSITFYDEQWWGVFAFGPLKANKAVPSGSYDMSITQDGDSIVFAPGAWITQPEGYVTVGLRGTISDDLMTIFGEVEFDTCTTFSMERTTPLPALPPPKRK